MTTPPPTPRRIDLDTYPRADILRAFADRSLPQLSVTCEVDVTSIRQTCQTLGVSFFLGMSYAVSRAVQAVPAFRQRVIDGVLCEYDRTDPGYTVARDGGLFSFCDGLHLDDFAAYCRENQARMDAVKLTPDLSVGAKHHMFFITTVPWLSFTAFTHPYDPLYAYIPVITLGKFSARSDTWVMPVAVQAHHGVVDGIHLAQFYEALGAVRLP